MSISSHASLTETFSHDTSSTVSASSRTLLWFLSEEVIVSFVSTLLLLLFVQAFVLRPPIETFFRLALSVSKTPMPPQATP